MAAAAARQKMTLKGAIEECDTSDLYISGSSTKPNRSEPIKSAAEDHSVTVDEAESMHETEDNISSEISSVNNGDDTLASPSSLPQDIGDKISINKSSSENNSVTVDESESMHETKDNISADIFSTNADDTLASLSPLPQDIGDKELLINNNGTKSAKEGHSVTVDESESTCDTKNSISAEISSTNADDTLVSSSPQPEDIEDKELLIHINGMKSASEGHSVTVDESESTCDTKNSISAEISSTNADDTLVSSSPQPEDIEDKELLIHINGMKSASEGHSVTVDESESKRDTKDSVSSKNDDESLASPPQISEDTGDKESINDNNGSDWLSDVKNWAE